jgi:general secretion pathway protein K
MNPRNEEGVILIALLWILVALSVIALSFSRESVVEVGAASNTRNLERSYFVARAGIASATYKLIQKRFLPRLQQVELTDSVDPLDLGLHAGKFGGGEYTVRIQDESGKININFASEEQLRRVIEATGIPKNDGDIIVDSILDWRDVDNAHRINGAEDEYYQSLEHPYQAKDGRIDTIEELLLIRGVTSDYFFGHPEKTPEGSVVYRYGLARCFTVYSTTNRINVNFAPLPVLMSVPGLTPQAAELIYEKRKTKPFANVEEITRTLPVTLEPSATALLATDPTGVYSLNASARMENSKVQRVIRAVISLDPREKNQYRALYWNENVSDYQGVTQ